MTLGKTNHQYEVIEKPPTPQPDIEWILPPYIAMFASKMPNSPKNQSLKLNSTIAMHPASTTLANWW